MTLSHSDLYDLMRLVHRSPGWLLSLSDALRLDSEDEHALAAMHDVWRCNSKAVEKYWRTSMSEMCRKSLGDGVPERMANRSGANVSENDIEMARLVPLDKVFDLPSQRGYVECPLHLERVGKADNHASMLVKNGFGYCFSCGGNLDSIGYLMKVNGMSFPDAVKKLIGQRHSG